MEASAVELIGSALLTGAAAGGKSAVTAAVNDAYTALKCRLVGHFRARASTEAVAQRHEAALEDFVDDPETYAKPFAKAVAETGADRDAEIQSSAEKLLRLAGKPMQVTVNSGWFDLSGSTGNHFGIGDQHIHR